MGLQGLGIELRNLGFLGFNGVHELGWILVTIDYFCISKLNLFKVSASGVFKIKSNF